MLCYFQNFPPQARGFFGEKNPKLKCASSLAQGGAQSRASCLQFNTRPNTRGLIQSVVVCVMLISCTPCTSQQYSTQYSAGLNCCTQHSSEAGSFHFRVRVWTINQPQPLRPPSFSGQLSADPCPFTIIFDHFEVASQSYLQIWSPQSANFLSLQHWQELDLTFEFGFGQ